MKQLILRLGVVVVMLFVVAGCSNKLDENGVKKLLTRFVSENSYVKQHCNQCEVGYVGPILVKENEGSVDFTIKYKNGSGEEKAVATFNRTQDGKWIFTEVRGNSWGGGWWTEPGEINWEVK